MNQFYRDYLNEEISRYGTNCEKWDELEKHFGRSDLTAVWVADMDFRTVPAVQEALSARMAHGIYGYTDNTKAEKAAEVGWLKRRHNFACDPEWILYSPGVIDSLFFCVRTLTAPGDKILIQPPVYGPFYRAVELFERTLIKSCLKETENGWEMDFDDLEKQFSEGVKMMILCSPHNPVGRVWTQEELQRLLAIANRYDVLIVADEIHADFTFDGRKQVRILSLAESDHCIMLTSATKSFNLAGLRQSSVIIKNPELRAQVAREIERAHATMPNIFGALAQTVAYNEGDEWMDAVCAYICENRDFAVEYIRENIPEISCRPQQGTYLMWLDFRRLKLSQDELVHKLINEAHVAMNDGRNFGEEGEGFFRLNLAAPRRNIVRVLENIKNMIRGR